MTQAFLFVVPRRPNRSAGDALTDLGDDLVGQGHQVPRVHRDPREEDCDIGSIDPCVEMAASLVSRCGSPPVPGLFLGRQQSDLHPARELTPSMS